MDTSSPPKRPEHLEINHRRQPLQRIALRREFFQTILNIPKTPTLNRHAESPIPISSRESEIRQTVQFPGASICFCFLSAAKAKEDAQTDHSQSSRPPAETVRHPVR